MEDELTLLDTPKRHSLQAQSIELRAALKQFERSFVHEHGHKPKQSDIKNDAIVAAKYKQYHRVQDVLTGRLAFEQLEDVDVRKSRGRKHSKKHSRQDSGLGSSPQKTNGPRVTPSKIRCGEQEHVYSSSPLLCSAIGPTPHRDGKVLGLFDLLQSGSRHTTTPSSSARKRKIQELYSDTPLRDGPLRSPLKSMQTPSQRQRSPKKQPDLLDHLAGTPQKSPGTHLCKLSRTPQSQGKKFELSKFFATPSTQRFLFIDDVLQRRTPERYTPLRDSILGRTPVQEPKEHRPDRTPQYLRRSTSFKDRLLSASQPAIKNKNDVKMSPPVRRIGPPTLRHFRSRTSSILPLSHLQQKPAALSHSQSCPAPAPNYDDYDDDLDALRELEGGSRPLPSSHALVEDSQPNFDGSVDLSDQEPSRVHDSKESLGPPTKTYRKKGQKRTTRKANIRVGGTISSKAFTEPNFVAADGSDDGTETRDVVNVAKLTSDDYFDDEDLDNLDEDRLESIQHRKKAKSDKGQKTKGREKQAGTINPNAQSHMNFRSLKIKNKNSKANGGSRGRFGKTGKRRGF